MPPFLPPLSLGRCSAPSRSFLRGPDGPAGAPPGQDLRSSALIGLRENREQKQDPYYKVPTVRGEPGPGWPGPRRAAGSAPKEVMGMTVGLMILRVVAGA